MSAVRCECPCLGCKHFCSQDPPAEGRDAHHTRILLALDRSVAAACRARGVAACDGLDDHHPCEIGDLHSRCAALAIALAAAIEDPSSASSGGAGQALEALLAELRRLTEERVAGGESTRA